MPFVHLHTHSHYSLLDGVPKIPELIAAAKKMHLPALALTDHGNLYGAIEFYQEAQAHNIKPIIGCEFYITAKTISDHDPKERPYHLVLLAKNKIGYQNLVKLVTKSHLQGFYGKPRIDLHLLSQHSAGLIGLSGCLTGEIPRAILSQQWDKAKQIASRYQKLFGQDYFFLEVQHHQNTPEQQLVNAGLVRLHEDLHLGLVATNDAHYINPEDAEAQDILVCIQTKKLLADDNRLSMRQEDYSLCPPQKMIAQLATYDDAIENTLKIAEMVNIEIELGKIQLPHYELPSGVTPENALTKLCEQGLQKRYTVVTDEISQRLQYELNIIKKTGFSSYFLIVQDFINWAKNQGIAVGPGRGSAAGSIVAYLTNITDIDPVRYNLLFERFLNPERVSMPDIDSDFADVRRDDVLHYVEQKYGHDHVAQVITFGTMAARAAVRDVGRVMGLSYGYCDRIAKMIPMFSSLEQAMATVAELRELIQNDADAERLMKNAQKLEGVARHTSTHACAVVVTKESLNYYVPVQYVDQNDKTIITQYSMHPIDQLGLLKIDLLGLKNLTIIENTLDLVRATLDSTIQIEKIPLTDKKTFKLLQQADTVGVFQLESSGMRRYLKQLKPTDIEDIIAMVSLYRPGPMEFIPDYIAGKHQQKKIMYLDKRLKPILEKTFGIAVYQEQVSEIAMKLAGFTYGEADVLRKAVAKKIKSLLDEQEQKMISGMIKNGINPNVAKEIWNFILPFARYGFNRSHAACYALIAYRTAYLKANFPVQFMAALMTADNEDTERIALEVKQTKLMGMEVLPPDINESYATFSVIKEKLSANAAPRIRFGLKAIKNVGNHLVEAIIKERKSNGIFKTLEAFLERVRDKDLNKKSLESLIKAGALDKFGERNQLLLNIDILLQFTKRAQDEKNSGQSNLFAAINCQPKIALAPAPPAEEKTRLQWEKELVGLYISGHPLAHMQNILNKESIPFATLKDYPKNKPVSLIGVITYLKKILTKNGEAMLFVGLQDTTAEIEAIVFPKTLQENATLWAEDEIIKVTGKLDDKDGMLKIIVERAQRYQHSKNEASASKQRAIIINLPAQIKRELFENLQQLLRQSPGEYRVYLNSKSKKIDTHTNVPRDIVPKIQKLFGQDVVHVLE